jgi:hypothetical protein
MWGVFTYRNNKKTLVSAPIEEADAREKADGWNEITNTNWYFAEPLEEKPSSTAASDVGRYSNELVPRRDQ